ncbi:Response regulator receiver domain-containing protein [Desulfuromusa kysingii]|uniref:Response regulator receiver domain-containing protein n=1 Tax=Desulfuromusa kysingii TaxID=37625 RepID=A0A1H3W997_9BACT|nr:response regulator [Desulfuromusa kysingii]SDZ83665.1 Response regulator receiver domain-containing protein [Desulfuromusa kysingii]
MSGELTGTTKKHILYVDDEECLALLGAELLDDCGYAVTCEFNGTAALEKFQQQVETFDLVVTDESMPGMSGIELAQAIFKISPVTPVILCSGHMLTMAEEGIEQTNIAAVLAKTEVCGLLPGMIEKLL